MKYIVILIAILLSLCVKLYADNIYLKDGKIFKATVISEDENSIVVESDAALKKISRNDILKIIRSEEQEYTAFVKYTQNEKKKRESRENSKFAIGLGAGIPYGMSGISAEVMVLRWLGLTAGYGADEISFSGYADHKMYSDVGIRVYLGDRDKAFRWRLTGLTGDIATFGRITNGQYENNMIKGKSLSFGFQWKMGTWLSLDLDMGYAVPDNSRINYPVTYPIRNNFEYTDAYSTSYPDHTTFNNFSFFALGFLVHL